MQSLELRMTTRAQVTKRARNALCAAAACFLVVDVLLAASVGVADWFKSTQAIRFQKEQMGRTGYDGQQTTQIDIRTSVHGRMIQDFTIMFDISKVGRRYGSFSCNLHIDWDYWKGKKSPRCDASWDRSLPTDMQEYADFFCNDDSNGVCPWLVALVAFNDDPSCAQLSAAASYSGVTDPIAAWEENAICTGAKGVLSVLVLAVVSATLGLVLCWFCSTGKRPRFIIIPGLLCAILSACAVIAYGVAISGKYPYEAALRENMRISDKNINPEVVAASSSVQTVQVGFGLAIGAAVIALFTCWLAFTAGYIVMSDVELQVVSALPIQIFQQNEPSAPTYEQQPIVVTATAVEYPVLASASVVVEAEHLPDRESGPSNMPFSTPHAESRIVNRVLSSAGSSENGCVLPQSFSGSVMLPDHPPPGAGGHSSVPHSGQMPKFEPITSRDV